MQPLLYSPFLQALGYTIINSLWQFALLWLLYVSVNTVFKLSSHQKYVLGLFAEILGFAWFVFTLYFYYQHSGQLKETAIPAHENFPNLLISSTTSFKEAFFLLVVRLEQFFPYLSIAYLALLVVLTLRWIFAYHFTIRVRFEGISYIGPDWISFVEKWSAQLQISEKVEIYLSELVQTPLTVGFLKPLILIPIATINYLNVQQLEAIILHELAHIKRYDYVWNLLLAIFEACLFFNPFMQLLHQQLKKERENCCDDWVLKYNYDAASYASALLKIASHQTFRPLLVLNATGNKKVLITRIKRIIDKNDQSFFSHKYQILALLVLTIVFSGLSLLAPVSKLKRYSSASHPESTREPKAIKISNPLFNPSFFLAEGSPDALEETREQFADSKLLRSKVEDDHNSAQLLNNNSYGAKDALANENNNDSTAELNLNALSTIAPLRNLTIASSDFNNYNLQIENALKEAETKLIEVKLPEWPIVENKKQMELAEASIRRIQKAAAGKVFMSLGKVRVQSENDLKKLASSRKKLELTKLKSIVGVEMKKIQETNGSKPFTGIKKLIQDKLIIDERDSEVLLDSLSEVNFYTTAFNKNNTFDIVAPAVFNSTVDSINKNHSYSYEFNNYPSVKNSPKPPLPPVKNNKSSKRKLVIILINEGAETEPKEIQLGTPVPPPAKKIGSPGVIRI